MLRAVGVAAFFADFDEGHAAFFGGASFSLCVEIGDVVDFKQPLRHWAAAIFAERFEQAAHEVRADDVVRFQLRVGDLRILLGRWHSQPLELVLFGRERQAHDFAEAEADEDLADAVAERFLGPRRADGHRADEPRLDVGVAVADGDVFEEVDHVADVGAVGGEGDGEGGSGERGVLDCCRAGLDVKSHFPKSGGQRLFVERQTEPAFGFGDVDFFGARREVGRRALACRRRL